MATIGSTSTLAKLVINRVPNQATYDNMLTNNQINTNELYFVEGAKTTVDGPSSAISDDIAIFNGTSGKIVKDSGVKITTATPASSSTTATVPTSSAVWNLIAGISGAITGTAGAGKTLTAFSQSNGKVTATFSEISISKSQVSDFSHAHGNITNDGKVGSTADYALHTTTGGAVTASSFAVTSPSASGTTTSFIDTVSQDSKGKISATKKTVTSATTSTAGIMAMSQANLNTMINQLSTGSDEPKDNDYYISQYVNGGSTTVTYHRRPMSKLYDYVKTKLNVTNNTVNLSYNTESTIATIGGTAIKVKLPASDNTDTKQNIVLATTSKAFLTGVTTTPTSTAQALTGVADTGVYLTATAGEISAVRHSFNVSGTEKAYMNYNSTTSAIDFIFV